MRAENAGRSEEQEQRDEVSENTKIDVKAGSREQLAERKQYETK